MVQKLRNKKYVRPVLVKYGSVRNLTGGSAGAQNGDGVGAMTMQ